MWWEQVGIGQFGKLGQTIWGDVGVYPVVSSGVTSGDSPWNVWSIGDTTRYAGGLAKNYAGGTSTW